MNTSTLYEHFCTSKVNKKCYSIFIYLSSIICGSFLLWVVPLSWQGLHTKKRWLWAGGTIWLASQSRYMHLQNHFFLVPRPYQPTDTALETTTRGHHVICTGGSPFISTPSFLMVFSNFTWFQTEFHYQRFSNVSCNNCNLMLTT